MPLRHQNQDTTLASTAIGQQACQAGSVASKIVYHASFPIASNLWARGGNHEKRRLFMGTWAATLALPSVVRGRLETLG